MNKKSIGIFVIIIIVIVIIIVVRNDRSSTDTANKGLFTVGAVFPLTGPLALWGETVKNGMDLALEDTTGIQVLYEDSKGVPTDGISAFNILQDKGVNLTITEISAVSVPLSKIALERKTPLFATLVAASSSVIVNDYTNRYYTDPAHYAGPAFTSEISPVKSATKIAVLYRNDELGNSVRDAIKDLAAQYKKEIVFIDSFKPAETDFSTAISKVKASNAEVLVFVPATPGEAVGIVKAAARLGLSMPLVEASAVFADAANRKQVEGIPFYSTSYDFSLSGEKAEAFKTRYLTKFGKDANFAAAFGYDIINLIAGCTEKAEGEKKDITECIRSISINQGIAGTANQLIPGDFVVTMHLEKVN